MIRLIEVGLGPPHERNEGRVRQEPGPTKGVCRAPDPGLCRGLSVVGRKDHVRDHHHQRFDSRCNGQPRSDLLDPLRLVFGHHLHLPELQIVDDAEPPRDEPQGAARLVGGGGEPGPATTPFGRRPRPFPCYLEFRQVMTPPYRPLLEVIPVSGGLAHAGKDITVLTLAVLAGRWWHRSPGARASFRDWIGRGTSVSTSPARNWKRTRPWRRTAWRQRPRAATPRIVTASLSDRENCLTARDM